MLNSIATPAILSNQTMPQRIPTVIPQENAQPIIKPAIMTIIASIKKPFYLESLTLASETSFVDIAVHGRGRSENTLHNRVHDSQILVIRIVHLTLYDCLLAVFPEHDSRWSVKDNMVNIRWIFAISGPIKSSKNRLTNFPSACPF